MKKLIVATLLVFLFPSLVSAEGYYFHEDHLGGSSIITNEDGEVVAEYNYMPYGELFDEVIYDEDFSNSYKFTDQEEDSETGLYYYGARYYGSSVGRFMAQDPAVYDDRLFELLQDPQSLNVYAYVRNNPVIFTDPNGEEWYNPATWDVNWRTTGEGALQMAMGIGEVVAGVSLLATSNPVGMTAGVAAISNGIWQTGEGVANVVVGMGGADNEPVYTGMYGPMTPDLTTMTNISSQIGQLSQDINVDSSMQDINSTMYIVNSGDTLYSVFGDNWALVAGYNNLEDPNVIYSGQGLYIPEDIEL